MSDTKNEYLLPVLDDCYLILVSKQVSWPKHFTKEMKMELYKHQIAFWESNDEFEKCITLKNKLKGLEKRYGKRKM